MTRLQQVVCILSVASILLLAGCGLVGPDGGGGDDDDGGEDQAIRIVYSPKAYA